MYGYIKIVILVAIIETLHFRNVNKKAMQNKKKSILIRKRSIGMTYIGTVWIVTKYLYSEIKINEPCILSAYNSPISFSRKMIQSAETIPNFDMDRFDWQWKKFVDAKLSEEHNTTLARRRNQARSRRLVLKA